MAGDAARSQIDDARCRRSDRPRSRPGARKCIVGIAVWCPLEESRRRSRPMARSRTRKLIPRTLLVAGAGLAAAICGACAGTEQPPPVGNLKPLPACDAGVCLPD